MQRGKKAGCQKKESGYRRESDPERAAVTPRTYRAG
jgi:hypothetical protein